MERGMGKRVGGEELYNVHCGRKETMFPGHNN